MTQKEQILLHLEKYGSITPHEALKNYGIMRLASRINELRKDGHRIITQTVIRHYRDGKSTTHAKYLLEAR